MAQTGLTDSSRAIITSLMSLAPGTKLGPYEITAGLGAAVPIQRPHSKTGGFCEEGGNQHEKSGSAIGSKCGGSLVCPGPRPRVSCTGALQTFEGGCQGSRYSLHPQERRQSRDALSSSVCCVLY